MKQLKHILALSLALLGPVGPAVSVRVAAPVVAVVSAAVAVQPVQCFAPVLVQPYRFASTWTPASISGLVLAHVAEDVSGADGDSVSTQPAAYGTSYAITQGTAAKKPTKQTAEVNGLAAINYDGTDDILTTSGDVPELASMAGLTVFAVCNDTIIPGGVVAMLAQFNYPEGPFFFGTGASVNGTTYCRLNSGATAGTLGTFSVTGQGTNVWKLLMYKFESNSFKVVKGNSTTIIGPTAYTGPLYDSTRVYAEGGYSVSGGHWPGMVAERLVYNRALTSTEINTVADYLIDKYGL